jgi:hypothetical protein
VVDIGVNAQPHLQVGAGMVGQGVVIGSLLVVPAWR